MDTQIRSRVKVKKINNSTVSLISAGKHCNAVDDFLVDTSKTVKRLSFTGIADLVATVQPNEFSRVLCPRHKIFDASGGGAAAIVVAVVNNQGFGKSARITQNIHDVLPVSGRIAEEA